VVRITFNSDWDTAESILIDAALEAACDITRVTKQAPYMRSEMYDYGAMTRRRYMRETRDRPRIVHEITKRVFKEFAKNRKVNFAIPYLYSSKTPFRSFETRPRAISAAP
jgi:small-conductance mechanosensitive channel